MYLDFFKYILHQLLVILSFVQTVVYLISFNLETSKKKIFLSGVKNVDPSKNK